MSRNVCLKQAFNNTNLRCKTVKQGNIYLITPCIRQSDNELSPLASGKIRIAYRLTRECIWCFSTNVGQLHMIPLYKNLCLVFASWLEIKVFYKNVSVITIKKVQEIQFNWPAIYCLTTTCTLVYRCIDVTVRTWVYAIAPQIEG